jgi:ABC-type multidrug transport system permease subunit
VSSKLYKPSAYYVAKQLAVLPFAVLNSLLFAFTLYGLAGLRHSAVAVGMNGLMSVLIYLIAAQVGGRVQCLVGGGAVTSR